MRFRKDRATAALQTAIDKDPRLAAFQTVIEMALRKATRKGFEAGALAAADLADQYNGVTAHEYRLGDCILAKMNLREKKPRRNPRARKRVAR